MPGLEPWSQSELKVIEQPERVWIRIDCDVGDDKQGGSQEQGGPAWTRKPVFEDWQYVTRIRQYLRDFKANALQYRFGWEVMQPMLSIAPASHYVDTYHAILH